MLNSSELTDVPHCRTTMSMVVSTEKYEIKNLYVNKRPFSSMNYGSCTLPEGQMVIEALLDGSLRGTGKNHLTPIFPCGIFQVGKGINKDPDDPNYYLFRKALKSTAKRIYPNYANLDWSGNKGYDKNDPRTYFSTMGK
jgi:ribonucleoside-triphosphate reductase (formate)